MLKPFFKPFFGSSLPTRLGKIIGKSNERVMLSGVDGPDGIRKKFRRNPDGSVTMLKTRAGMPQFSTPITACTPGGEFLLQDANLFSDETYGDHQITFSTTVPSPGRFKIWVVPAKKEWSATISGITGPLTVSAKGIVTPTVPYGSWNQYPEYITVDYTAPGAIGGQVLYTLYASLVNGCDEFQATGTRVEGS